MELTERQKQLAGQLSVWSERAEISRDLNKHDVASAADKVVRICQTALETQNDNAFAEVLRQANQIRKQIEASEQHRTMCVEHGLSDAAIDATYEIEGLEKQLVELLAKEAIQ